MRLADGTIGNSRESRTALVPAQPAAHRCPMSSLLDTVAEIDATWFGAGLSDQSRRHLAELARDYDAPAGARLLREGDETRELGVLVSGRVALTQRVPGHESVTIMTVDPGDIFGWTALIPPFIATSSFTAMAPVHVLALDGARLRTVLHTDLELAAGLYQQLLEAVARRLMATRQQLLDVYRAEAMEPW